MDVPLKGTFQPSIEPPVKDVSLGLLTGTSNRRGRQAARPLHYSVLASTRFTHASIYVQVDWSVGTPTAVFFLYDKKDEHFDNTSGNLYKYSVNGTKLLHSPGMYNNVYSGEVLRGGDSGKEILDLLLVMHNWHGFPLHPNRQSDDRDFMRRGSLKNLTDRAFAESNTSGDSFGQFAFDDYGGLGSRKTRRMIVTRECYLVVANDHKSSKALASDYSTGPYGISLYHQLLRLAAYPAWRYRTLSQRIVLISHSDSENASPLAAAIETHFTESGDCRVLFHGTNIRIQAKETWYVSRDDP